MNPQSRDPFAAALHTIKKLRAAGHTALLAGGCVRDRLLGLSPKDYDVVTDATPRRVVELFPRARHVGAKFGVVIVRRHGHDLEVATFRADGPYLDGRHPDRVSFGSPEEDARRRDFTINGLFHDPFDDRIIDYVNGRADIEAGIIRTIGDPDRRFEEDHLRMLRAVRFAARLGFSIESKTFQAIRQFAHHLQTISPERIWMELEMILTDPSRRTGWELLLETGLRPHLSPAWPAASNESERLASLRLATLRPTNVSNSLALAAILADRPKRDIARIGRSLRLSNRTLRNTVWLVGNLLTLDRDDGLELAELKRLMAHESWGDLLHLLKATRSARGRPLDLYERIAQRAEAIDPADIAPPPLITGDDLIAMGMTPGPRYGEMLETIYRAQLNERIHTRDEALRLLRSQNRA